MKRYRITTAYDGTGYAGWQIQPNGLSVQQQLQEALRELTSQACIVHGSGRTDQGVHARGQVAHFDLAKPMQPKRLHRGLNALLPPDIRILKCAEAAADFHARRSAVSKEYRYFIHNGDVLPPFQRHYRLHKRQPLDPVAMQRAAAILEGRHDFAAFTANSKQELGSTVRRLDSLRVRKRGPEIVIVARGEGFLYKMVRSLAGLLIRVGEGVVPPGEARAILTSRLRTSRVPTAAPQGLFLWAVFYR